jgi:putative restriction endonuclease
MNPELEMESDLLQRVVIDRAGGRISLPEDSLKPQYVAQHNAALEWV